MTMLWAWESAGPLAGGRGLSDDQVQAREAAAAWMVDHGAASAVLEEVALVCVGIDPVYLPVGDCRSFEASRDALGEIRWRALLAERAGELGAPGG